MLTHENTGGTATTEAAQAPSGQPVAATDDGPPVLAGCQAHEDPAWMMGVGVAGATLVIIAAVVLGVWLSTGDLLESVGLGAFAAIWGGPGFGLMAGGAIYALQEDRLAAEAQQRLLVAKAGPITT
ncbi:MAG: hypothetical protein GEV08_10405 [Acidimicrobiia bacterium]|nr:hypothetical protein [Acidimicrobiia bacterium]